MKENNYLTTGLNDTKPYLDATVLRTSPDYIKYYYVGTHFITSALIPIVMLLFLNIRIIFKMYETLKEVQR